MNSTLYFIMRFMRYAICMDNSFNGNIKEYHYKGVEVADVVEATVLVVCIDPVRVRVPAVAATKMDVGKAPCTECAPMV